MVLFFRSGEEFLVFLRLATPKSRNSLEPRSARGDLWLRFAKKSYEIIHSHSKTRPFTTLNRYVHIMLLKAHEGHED